MLFFSSLFMHLQGKIIPLDVRESLDNPPEDGVELIDKISYVLYGDDETVVLTDSDLQRSTIDGRVLSPEEWLGMYSAYLDAQRFKIELNDEDVDKTLLGVQKEYSLTEDDLRAMFKAGGYTWEEARRQLGIMQIEKSRIDWELSSNTTDRISDEDVKIYCQNHPNYIQGKYTVQRAVVLFDPEQKKKKQRKALQEKISKNNLDSINWSTAYTLDEDDLSDSALTVFSKLCPGEVSPINEVFNGFEITRLVSKIDGQNQPWQERKSEVEAALKQQKFNEVLAEFYDKILEQTPIVKY